MSAFFHTLRFRLALWYALSLALVLGTFGVLLYGLVRYQLVQHHDATLKEAAAAVARVLSQREDCEHLAPEQLEALDRIGHVVLFHEVEGQGRVFYRSSDSTALTVPIEHRTLQALSEERGWFELLPAARAPLRMYSEPYRSRVGRRALIRIIQDLGDIVEPLARLRLALLFMSPLAVLVSAAGGYWLAGRALAPVDQVTRMARDIGASSLGRRLPGPKGQDEIGRLVDTLNQMIARLEASFEAMKRFTADASHQLRGPLATMRGAIDVALGQHREAAEYRRVLESVGDDVNRLRSIAEDLLVLARADAGHVQIEKVAVRLDVVAAEVVESLLPRAVQHRVALSAECGLAVAVLGDERWLRQLVLNLLDNAIKFSAATQPEGKDLPVSVEVGHSEGLAWLEVSDSGPGVREEALSHLFERFYRDDAARGYGRTEGTGLGLAIAAWIVEAHGGSITARNRPAGGSMFRVTLPPVSSAQDGLAPQEESAPQERAAGPALGNGTALAPSSDNGSAWRRPR